MSTVDEETSEHRLRARARRKRAWSLVPVILVLAVGANLLHHDEIGTALAARTRITLHAAGYDGVQVGFAGREAAVRGQVPRPVDLLAVEALIEGQRGVRWADMRQVRIVAGPTPAPASQMPASQTPASQMPASQMPASQMPTSQAPASSASAAPASAAAEAPPSAPASSVVTARITRGEGTPSGPHFTLTSHADGARLSGRLPSAESREVLTQAVARALTVQTDALEVVEGPTPSWLPAAFGATPALLALKSPGLVVDARRIVLRGTAPTAEARAAVEAAFARACPGHALDNRIITRAPGAPDSDQD